MAALDFARFAKVRALHERTDHLGERAAAAQKLQNMALAAGMTVEEACLELDDVFTLDAMLGGAPDPHSASRDDWHEERRARRRAVLAEYGSVAALFADTPIEHALRQACAPLLDTSETSCGRHTLAGWAYGSPNFPDSVRDAVSTAWPLPKCVAEAWAEYQSAEKLDRDRYAVRYDYSSELFVDARRLIIIEILNSLPAQALSDLNARIDWLDYWAYEECNQEIEGHRATLKSLRKDIQKFANVLRRKVMS